LGWGKGGNVTSAGWQVTLCAPVWHVSSRSGVATLRTLFTYLLTYLRRKSQSAQLHERFTVTLYVDDDFRMSTEPA